MDFEKSLSAPGGDFVTMDRISFDYRGFDTVVGTVNTTFKNISELRLENGHNQSALDSYVGFLYDDQTHDLSYKTGEDSILLLHLNKEIDTLTLVVGNVDGILLFEAF